MNKSLHLMALEKWIRDTNKIWKLEFDGFKVLTIWEEEINNTDVSTLIMEFLNK